MITQVLIPIAHGFEEIETVTPVDLLRRAEVEVVLASCEDSLDVIGRSGISMRADCYLSEIKQSNFDMLVLPGGPAVFELRKKTDLLQIIKSFAAEAKPIGAICAAPLLLKDAGILNPSNYTAHCSVIDEIGGIASNKDVVIDHNLITSRGAGTALNFGLALVEHLQGQDRMEEIRESIHA